MTDQLPATHRENRHHRAGGALTDQLPRDAPYPLFPVLFLTFLLSPFSALRPRPANAIMGSVRGFFLGETRRTGRGNQMEGDSDGDYNDGQGSGRG
jgi:hypothetical protein